MDKRALAESLFMSGYNCAQSVFLAFEAEVGLPRETMLRLSAPLGGGVGGLREACGALTGAALVLGALKASDDPTDQSRKSALYGDVAELGERFQIAFDALRCRELLARNEIEATRAPSPRTPAYYAKRPCAAYIGFAAEWLEQALRSDVEP